MQIPSRFTIAVQSHSQLFLSGLFLAALERNGLLFLELFDLGLFFFYGDGSGVQLRGHCAEGCFFPFVILGSPMIILYCLQYLMETLFGNPYGEYFMGYGTTDLPTTFKAFNPILFLYDGVNNLSALDASGKLIPSSYGEGAPWVKPNFLPLVFWTIAVVAVMFLGMYLFRKRKAEICGFLGANSVLNFFITFLLGFLGFGLVIHVTQAKLPMALAIVVGLLVFTVIYCIVDFALIRNGKEFLRGLK